MHQQATQTLTCIAKGCLQPLNIENWSHINPGTDLPLHTRTGRGMGRLMSRVTSDSDPKCGVRHLRFWMGPSCHGRRSAHRTPGGLEPQEDANTPPQICLLQIPKTNKPRGTYCLRRLRPPHTESDVQLTDCKGHPQLKHSTAVRLSGPGPCP
jgi:hypothetical protein